MNNKIILKTASFRDLLKIKVVENNESLVKLRQKNILYGYLPGMLDMQEVLGQKILIRITVSNLLCEAQEKLTVVNPGLSLYVTYGYRTLKIQTMLFLKELTRMTSCYFQNPYDLYETIHRLIAVPNVAGHPTGGAIDITIINRKTREFIDMGSSVYNFKANNCFVYSPNITKKALKNRLLLRSCMTSVGFAPFNEEWWHFSYGDREWAFYYNRKNAIYDQIKNKFSNKH